MRNLRPIGIPHSILVENLFAKAYDSTKLDMDMDMLRNFYQERGYFNARAVDREVNVRDVGGGKFRVPLFYMNRPGKRADITVQVEEGRQYRLNKINFVGMKLFKTQDFLATQVFKMGPGDVFSTAKLRKGMKELQKLYGNVRLHRHRPGARTPSLSPTRRQAGPHAQHRRRQASSIVRRIDFSGNTTTRDKVIRRELLIEEGDMFSHASCGTSASCGSTSSATLRRSRRRKPPTSGATRRTTRWISR